MVVSPVLDHGIDFGGPLPGYTRGAGLHMSELYNGMYQSLQPEKYTDAAPNPLLLDLGTGWEMVLKRRIRAQLAGWNTEPGEFIEPQHNIIYSPDLTIFNGCMKMGEIKLTFMSSREWPTKAGESFPPGADKYLSQMKLYCYCLEVDTGYLLVTFAMGDYRKDRKVFGPEFRMWKIVFNPRELRDEWQTVTGFGKHRGLIHG